MNRKHRLSIYLLIILAVTAITACKPPKPIMKEAAPAEQPPEPEPQ